MAILEIRSWPKVCKHCTCWSAMKPVAKKSKADVGDAALTGSGAARKSLVGNSTRIPESRSHLAREFPGKDQSPLPLFCGKREML